MEENTGVGLEREVESTRREFLGDAIDAAKAAVGAVFLSALGLSEVLAQSAAAREELDTSRGSLFGGLWKKGELEHLTYDTYARKSGVYWSAVTRAVNFVNGENSHLYRAVYGTRAERVWRADRKRVLGYFLRAITIPERESHERMRGILRSDGILNFVWHKQKLNDALDKALPRYAAASESVRVVLRVLGVDIQELPRIAGGIRND